MPNKSKKYRVARYPEISDKNLKHISVIGKDELAKNYSVMGKSYGIIISADLPPEK